MNKFIQTLFIIYILSILCFKLINKACFLFFILNSCFINSVLSQHDTTYYKQYPHKLVVTVYQSLLREHNIQFSSNNNLDTLGISNLNYVSQSKYFTGLAFDYDLFGLSIGINTLTSESRKKGNVSNTNIGFTFGSNKIAFETSYRNYKGFYEKNSSQYLNDFKDITPYFQKSKMNISSLKCKIFYYFNHKKFSYKAAYATTHRQLKSSWSPIVSGGLYYNRLGVDSTFFPYQVSSYYDKSKYLTDIEIYCLSLGTGLSGNLIFLKKLFFNTTLLISLEGQKRNYEYLNINSTNSNYISFGGDFRSSIGYNSEKFMFFVSAFYEFSKWNKQYLNINNQFNYAQINLAYRFGVKKPKWYHIIENNKIYKWF